MKALCLTAMITLFLIFCSSIIQGQNPQDIKSKPWHFPPDILLDERIQEQMDLSRHADNSRDLLILNQVELIKQFIGSWQCSFAKDTSSFLDLRSFGSGLEGSYMLVAKGETIKEAKTLLGYDNKIDKCIQTILFEGNNIEIYAFWFISNTKFEMYLFKDIAYPDWASVKILGEFKTPDMLQLSSVENNSRFKVQTWFRVKE